MPSIVNSSPALPAYSPPLYHPTFHAPALCDVALLCCCILRQFLPSLCLPPSLTPLSNVDATTTPRKNVGNDVGVSSAVAPNIGEGVQKGIELQ